MAKSERVRRVRPTVGGVSPAMSVKVSTRRQGILKCSAKRGLVLEADDGVHDVGTWDVSGNVASSLPGRV